jgi:signal transduction histidine kinase
MKPPPAQPSALLRRWAAAGLALFALLAGGALVLRLGWLDGLAYSLLLAAVGGLTIAFYRLRTQMQSTLAENEALLAESLRAHQKLKDYIARAEELAATRERNRMARGLHESVSQVIFSISLTSQATRLLLERDPQHAPDLLDRLEELTSSALEQLRSLLAEMESPR